MPWTFEDGSTPPEGGDRRFTQGALKNRTSLDVTIEHPQQFFTTIKSKTLSAEQKSYVEWVKLHFIQEGKNLAQKVENPPLPGAMHGTACPHENTHNKGSSTQTIRTTCKDCGEIWYTERHPVTIEAEECLHHHTDHRGSNKFVRKTYCKDCGTYIDTIAQPLAKSLKEENPWTSVEEQALIDRVSDTQTIDRQKVEEAAQLMLIESRSLEEGEY